MSPPPARVLCLARVSSDDQGAHGTSLAGQSARFRSWCEDEGYPEPIVYVEVESAGEERREHRGEYDRLLADARAGDLVAVLVVDRWTRDVVDGVGSVRRLLKMGVGWVAIDEGIDARTGPGYEQLLQRAAAAEAERRRIRDRTFSARRRLAARGLWAEGHPPYGYRRGARVDRRHLHLEPHPEDAAVVLELYQRCVAGESTRALARWLAGHPRAPQGLAAPARMLRNPVFLGRMRDGRPGAHPAIVDQATWDRAQRALDDRRLSGPPSRVASDALLLAGLLRCELCGHRCTVAVGPAGTRYYVCAARRAGPRRALKDEEPGTYDGTRALQPTVRGPSPGSSGPLARGLPGPPAARSSPTSTPPPRLAQVCAGPYARAVDLDAAAGPVIVARIRELREAILAGVAAPAAAEDTRAARARIASRRARAVSLAVDESITPEQLKQQQERLDAEEAALDRREASHRAAPRQIDRERVAAALDRLDGERWAALTLPEQRAALGALAERVSLGADRALRWRWRPAGEL